MIVKKHTNIVQANQLIENRPSFTKDETRLFLTVIGSINKDDTDFNLLEIPVREFAELWGIDTKNAYTTIKNALRGLRNKEFFIEGVNPETGKMRFITSSSISTAIYEEGQGYAVVEISSAFKPYLLALKEKYTNYVLKNIMDLSTVNAIRNYELLKQYQVAGSRTFDIETYKKMLNIEGKYPVNADLKRYVIEPSLEEINAKTDIEVSYKIIGRGKTAKIVFTIKKRKMEVSAISVIDREKRTFKYCDEDGIEGVYELESNEIFVLDPETNTWEVVFLSEEQMLMSDEELIKDLALQKELRVIEKEVKARLLKEEIAASQTPEGSIEDSADYDYGSDQLDFLADACEREFNPAQMEELYLLIKEMRLVENPFTDSLEIARYDYLSEKYNKMNARAKRSDLKPIENRFAYLKTIIDADLV